MTENELNKKIDKTWLEERFPLGEVIDDLHVEGEKERLGVTEVCKKILEEVSKNLIEKECEGAIDWYITESDIIEIIKDLGVSVKSTTELNEKVDTANSSQERSCCNCGYRNPISFGGDCGCDDPLLFSNPCTDFNHWIPEEED